MIVTCSQTWTGRCNTGGGSSSVGGVSGALASTSNRPPRTRAVSWPPTAASRVDRFSRPPPSRPHAAERGTPSLATCRQMVCPEMPAWIEQCRAALCRSMLVTASRKTVASTVSTLSSGIPQLISTCALIPAAVSSEETELASLAREMLR